MSPVADISMQNTPLRSPIFPRAWCRCVIRDSAIEHKPADLVAQRLVIEDEVADFDRKLCALPCALQATGCFRQAGRCRGACGLDSIGCGAEFVGGDMRHDSG